MDPVAEAAPEAGPVLLAEVIEPDIEVVDAAAGARVSVSTAVVAGT